MARHNRTGEGADQRGHVYEIRYQPDWLRRVKVTRHLESGRQSTMNLFRNPAQAREADPGPQVRSGISAEDQDIDFDVIVNDPQGRVVKVSVTVELPAPESSRGRGRNRRTGPPEQVVFTFENGLREPPTGR